MVKKKFSRGESTFTDPEMKNITCSSSHKSSVSNRVCEYCCVTLSNLLVRVLKSYYDSGVNVAGKSARVTRIVIVTTSGCCNNGLNSSKFSVKPVAGREKVESIVWSFSRRRSELCRWGARWREVARGGMPLEAPVYAYECPSGNSQVFMQTASSVHRHAAAPITLSAHSSTYPAVSCSRYFSSSFRRRRDTWKRCAALAHTIDFICVHIAHVFAMCFRILPRRESTQTSFSPLCLSLSFFLRLCSPLFFRHSTYELRFLRDRINHATSVHDSPSAPHPLPRFGERLSR